MKQLAFVLFFSCVSIGAMDNPLLDSSIDDSKAFSDEMFAQEDSRYQAFLQNKSGRELLLVARAAERRALNSSQYELKMGIQRFLPSQAFGVKNVIDPSIGAYYETGIPIRDARILKEIEKTEFGEVIQAVADTEYFLTYHGNSLGTILRDWYELSRRDDIILLRKIVERDYTPEYFSIHRFLDQLKTTHESWPPKRCPGLNAPSGYHILSRVLAERERREYEQVSVRLNDSLDDSHEEQA